MKQRILFNLTPKHLIVANTGKVFTKNGFEAICYTDTSPKKTNQSLQALFENDTQSWVSEILKKKRNTFSDPNQLQSAAATEQRTAKDYADRLILELLQNAIDAGIEEPIGYKGIGIRSILNESEKIEVHSGNLHVKWSEKDAKDALQDSGELPESLPILDLPAWSRPDDEIQEVLNRDYQTVIRLALSEKGRQRVEEEWKKFSNNPSLLLFIDTEISIRWQSDGQKIIQWNRFNVEDLVTIKVLCGDSTPQCLYWRVFGSKSVKAAYSVNESSKFKVSAEKTPRLCSFFPAAQSPHPFPNLYLHHAKFELHSNRQSIRTNEQHLQEVGKAILLAVKSIEDENDLLDLIHINQINANDTDRLETKLWNIVQPMLANTKLKSLRGRCLAEIKSCLLPKKDHLPYDWWNEKRWEGWEAFLAALKKNRPNGISDLPVLDPGTENDSREKTLLAFNPACSFRKEELQKLDWAPVGESNVPVSSFTTQVFLSLDELDLQPPDGIEVSFLSPAFVKEFKEKTNLKIENFLETVLSVQKFTVIGVIKHCLLPALSLNLSPIVTIELLKFLKALLESDKKESKKSVDSFDWKEPTRCILIQKLQLECQGTVWPLLRVYASQKWTGHSYLENVYGDERGYLEMEPPDDEDERNSWIFFLKWLGVGWCPKVLPLIKNVINKPRDHQGLNWENNVFHGQFFETDTIPDAWNDYCYELQKDDSFKGWKYRLRIKSNWTIDGGPEVLEKKDTFNVIGTNWSAYKDLMKADFCTSSNAREDNDNVPKHFQSYLAWLIKTIRWVPSTDEVLHQGNGVFFQNSPVIRKIPKFVAILKFPIKNEQGQPIFPIEFLNHCGIRKDWELVEDTDWRSWLELASKMKTNNDNITNNRDAIRSLYRALLDHRKLKIGPEYNQRPINPLNNISLWSIERSDSPNEVWKLRKPDDGLPYFVDRGDLADLMLPGLYVFPVRLDNLAKKAAIHFNLKALSKMLSGEPSNEGVVIPHYSDSVIERMNEIIAYLRTGKKRLSDDEFKKALLQVTLREVRKLLVQFSLNESPLGTEVRRSEFINKNRDDSWTIYVDESLCRQERRKEVFAETLLLSCGLDVGRRKEVRDLLYYTLDELPGELQRLGVAPETVQDLTKSLTNDKELENTSSIPNQTLLVTSPETKADVEPKSIVTTGIITPENNSQIENRPAGNNEKDRNSPEVIIRRNRNIKDGSIHPSTRPHPEDGIKAQRWLFKRIHKWCQLQGLNDPLWEQDYVDITVQFKSPVMIEVKRIEGRTIHWSSSQIQKAHSSNNFYVLSLLRPHKDEQYEVFWVFDSLNVFKTVPSRYIEWTWRPLKGKGFAPDSWEKPESPPSKPANSYNAVISLTDNWIEKLPKGTENGLKLISELVG